MIAFATLLYCCSVVYSLNIGFPTTKNYGSINHVVKNNDFGIKTLGFLVRTGRIEVSKTGSQYRIILDFEGASYYLGAAFHAWVIRDIQAGVLERPETYVVVFLHHIDKEGNAYAKREAEKRGLSPFAHIVRGDEVLADLYSNRGRAIVQYYDVRHYNSLFDKQFGNLDTLPALWLGHG